MSFAIVLSYKLYVFCCKYCYLSIWIYMVNISGVLFLSSWIISWIISTNVIFISGVSGLLSRSILRSLTQWQACLWKSTLNNCFAWAELKCGLGSLTPTCCLPTLRSYGGPPHFVVLTACTCIPCIAVSKVSRAAHYLCLLVSLSLFRLSLPCCLETKWSKNGDNGERGRRCLTSRGWKRREIRGEDRPSRGVMKFVWDTLDFYGHCVVPVSSLYSQLKQKCLCRY